MSRTLTPWTMLALVALITGLAVPQGAAAADPVPPAVPVVPTKIDLPLTLGFTLDPGDDPVKGDKAQLGSRNATLGDRFLDWWRHSKAVSWLRNAVQPSKSELGEPIQPTGYYLRSPLLTGRFATPTPSVTCDSATTGHDHSATGDGHDSCPEHCQEGKKKAAAGPKL